jgi:predicted AlkP superfamily phosphohydrolase/phosphomutase
MASSASASFLALILVLGVTCSCDHSATRGRKVIVLGVDGMDPAFLERHWNDLPNLDRLRRHGDFKRLGTTMPPQSPVAWSAFITGMDPSGHGIFDFVHRDPKTLRPFSSMSQTEQPRFTLTLGPYVLPLSRARARTLRKGQAFWEILANRRIPVTVIHMPTNFPPIQAGARSRITPMIRKNSLARFLEAVS